MKRLLFLCVLFGFLSWNVISSEDTLADNYTEVEVKDGGTVVGNVKYMGDLTTLPLNLYADSEITQKPYTATSKIITYITYYKQ